MSVTDACRTVPQIGVMYCVVFHKINSKYMVCVRSFLLLCQHFYTPSWPLPIRWTGISQKGLVSPGICPYKNCVSIFFTRLLLRPSSPRIPKEKEVRHHAVMLWITHLVTFVVLRCILSWVIWLERTSVRTWCVMIRFRLLTQTFGWYAGFSIGRRRKSIARTTPWWTDVWSYPIMRVKFT